MGDRIFQDEMNASQALKTSARANKKPSFSESARSRGFFPALGGAFSDLIKTVQSDEFKQYVDFPSVVDRLPDFERRGEQAMRNTKTQIGKEIESLFGPGSSPFSEGGQPQSAEVQNNKLRDEIDKKNLEDIAKTTAEMESLDEAWKSGNLSPTQQKEVDARRAQLTDEIRQLHVQHAELSTQKRMSEQAIRDEEEQLFGPGGLMPGASKEEISALDSLLTGDATPQEYQGVIDSIMNSNIGDEAKTEKLEFILDNSIIQEEMMITMEDIIESRRGLEILKNSTDERLLGSDLVTNTPQFATQLEIDTVGRTQESLTQVIDTYWEMQTGSGMTAEAMQLLIPVMEAMLADPGYITTPQYETQIAELVANQPHVSTKGLTEAIIEGFEVAMEREESWVSALDQDNYQAGQDPLRYALFKAAIGAPSVGGDESLANIIASSKDIHLLINAVSGGKVGAQGKGSKMGLGGLTPAAYERLGLDPASVGDAAMELHALIEYIMEWGGPAAAIRGYRDSGMWGD